MSSSEECEACMLCLTCAKRRLSTTDLAKYGSHVHDDVIHTLTASHFREFSLLPNNVPNRCSTEISLRENPAAARHRLGDMQWR